MANTAPGLIAASDSEIGEGGTATRLMLSVHTDGTYVYFGQVCVPTEHTADREFRLVRVPERSAQ